MKTLKIFSFGLVALLFMTSCENEELNQQEESLKTNNELVQLLKNDTDFINYFNKTQSLKQNLFLKQLEVQKNNHYKKSTSELEDLKDVSLYLNLEDNFFDNYFNTIQINLDAIKLKYSDLSNKSEEDVIEIFQNTWLELTFDKEISNTYARTSSCESEFQATMSSIHSTYDSSLVTCAAIGLFTGGGPGVLCAGVATVVAIAQTAAAIDAHTVCSQNQ